MYTRTSIWRENVLASSPLVFVPEIIYNAFPPKIHEWFSEINNKKYCNEWEHCSFVQFLRFNGFIFFAVRYSFVLALCMHLSHRHSSLRPNIRAMPIVTSLNCIDNMVVCRTLQRCIHPIRFETVCVFQIQFKFNWFVLLPCFYFRSICVRFRRMTKAAATEPQQACTAYGVRLYVYS